MSQAGYTPIQLYYSTTASATPTAGNLANGELAINITDGKLYYKDNTGTVKVIAGAGGAGVAGGSNTQVQYNSSGSLAGSSNLTFNGTTLTATGNTIISDNSTNAALRITQTGTGNALLVEDEANPDSTPFAVDANGNALLGITTRRTVGLTNQLQVEGTSADSSAIGITRNAASTGAGYLILGKSRGTTTGSVDSVASGDQLGRVAWYGADGTSFVNAANILGEVDGTPGTNDMPGRLIFSTTADGASSPTERMRINSSGNVGIGSSSLTGINFRLSTNITGAVASSGMYQTQTVQSDVTTGAYGKFSSIGTAAAAFTLPFLRHNHAEQGTFGAGSTVTSQYGYFADSSLTGATNNYGFYGNIASGTGRYNVYMAGTADNYFAGSVGIGSASLTGYQLRVSLNATGSVSTYPVYASPAVQSDVTTQCNVFSTFPSIQDAAFTLPNLRHFQASQGTKGASATLTNQIGFEASSTLTGATNNYGFYSNIASGTGRHNFYAAGTANNYFAGSLGIGTTSLTGYNLYISKNITGAVTAYNFAANGTVQSDVTSAAYGVSTYLQTQATAFTLPTLAHYAAAQGTIGAGSTVTNQFGYRAEASLTGATNNYGFYSDIASGTGRYNFYANGTANNYFAGNVGINTTTPTTKLDVAGSSSLAAFRTPNILEISTVSATAATGTINYDVTTQSVVYYTTNASGNFTLNFRGSSGTSLNTIMNTGDTVTVTFLCTNGSTAYYNSAVQVDGSSVTPKWLGGTAPTSGNASSVDAYTYAIIKTGSATFTVLASQTKFA